MRIPDFIIGGAPRCGTTWLCHLLARHPEIGVAQPIAPEPKFFLIDDLYRRGLPYYAERWFGHLDRRVVGEKSTNYLESEAAAERIGRDLPGARLIFLLRDPVERAFSNWRWSRANGHETLGFEAALDAEATRPVAPDLRYARPFAYVARGMYARSLRPYLDRFGPDRVLLLRFDDLGRDLAARVHDFLGVAARPDDAHPLPAVNAATTDHLAPGTRARLARLFAAPDRELAELAGFDLTGWTSQTPGGPMSLATEAVCLTVDVEWAHPEVLSDLRTMLDARGLRATFFCTHDGVAVPGHERALHPNFRADGDCLRELVARDGPRALADQLAVYRFAMEWFHAFVPEALGVRGHGLHYDSRLLGIYRARGIRYDSTYQLPLAEGLRPFWKEGGILELPIFYNDYFDLHQSATGFAIAALNLHRPGLKILNFHPNIVFGNLGDPAAHERARACYHDPQRLRGMRTASRGPRDLFQRVLDAIAEAGLPTATLAEVLADWRGAHPPPWP